MRPAWCGSILLFLQFSLKLIIVFSYIFDQPMSADNHCTTRYYWNTEWNWYWVFFWRWRITCKPLLEVGVKIGFTKAKFATCSQIFFCLTVCFSRIQNWVGKVTLLNHSLVDSVTSHNTQEKSSFARLPVILPFIRES